MYQCQIRLAPTLLIKDMFCVGYESVSNTDTCDYIQFFHFLKLLSSSVSMTCLGSVLVLHDTDTSSYIQLFHFLRLVSVVSLFVSILRMHDLIGYDLSWQSSKGKLTEAHGRKMFQQLIDGVSYCHNKGVFHRDLKVLSQSFQQLLQHLWCLNWNCI